MARRSVAGLRLAEFPDLLAQVDSMQDINDPGSLSAASGKMIWWRCLLGPDHTWKARVVARTVGGTGCPCCAGKQVSITNSVASQRPDLAEQWDAERNDCTPAEVTIGSTYKAYWRCNAGPDHTWQAQVNQRVGAGGKPATGCPACAGRQLSVTNSLGTLRPDLAEQFDLEANDGYTPDDVLGGTATVYSWRCDVGFDHRWEASVDSRVRGRGCPFCAGKKVSVTNSLASCYPDVARQLDPTINRGLTADRIQGASHRMLTWRCPVDSAHVWQAKVYNRTIGGRGCPHCAGKHVTAATSLAATYPSIAAQLDEQVSGVRADELLPRSNRRLTWRCQAGPDHIWKVTVNQRTSRGSGCPACAGRQLSVTNNLATLFPEISAQLDVQACGLTADQILAGSEQELPWRCEAGADHCWTAPVVKRTSRGDGCPFCAGKRVSATNNLADQFPDLAKQYDESRNNVPANQVISGSNKPVWWTCAKGRDHTWRTSPAARTRLGTGCPCCANLQVSVTNSLATLYPNLARQLADDHNGGLTAADIIAGSQKKVWWRCPAKPAHVWQALVSNRTRYQVGCPYCVGKISKPQLVLTAELAWVLEGSGVNVDPPGTRVAGIDPDIHLTAPDLMAQGIPGIAVLYDGSYWHLNKEDADRRSTSRLERTGRLVLRVRQRPLRPLGGNEVLFESDASMKTVANLIIAALTDPSGPFALTVPLASEYLEDPNLQAVDEAIALIARYGKNAHMPVQSQLTLL